MGLYRTEKWLKALNGKQLTFPVCVPSYNRPDAPIFQSRIPKEVGKSNFFVCIRNDPEQIKQYQYLEDNDIANIVLLEGCSNLGNTRKAIICELYNRGYDNIFMLDDTITRLFVNKPRLTKTGKTYFGNAVEFNNYQAFLLWEFLHNNYREENEAESERGAVLSGPGQYKGYDWEPGLINAPMEAYNRVSYHNAICISTKTLIEHDCNYESISEVGAEDLYISYRLFNLGAIVRSFTDLSMEQANTQKTQLSGGDNANSLQSRAERLDYVRKLFVENTLHRKWLDDISDLGMRYRKTKYEGTGINFDKRYWKNRYEQMRKDASINRVYPIVIPGDTGHPWRYQKLIEYIGNFPDEIGPLVTDFLKSRNATRDDVVWWVLLYSACYCMGTACVLYDLINYRTVTEKELETLWKDHKKDFIFQSDRRYIKNMNQFNDIINEFIRRSHRKPWKYIQRFIGDTPESTYESMYKEVSSWKYYGRFGTILFMYNLNKILHVKLDYPKYDWAQGATTTAAIFNARYKDERADLFEDGAKLSPKDIENLDAYLKRVKNDLKAKYPNKNWTVMGVTSDLCSYRKLFKQTRYMGFYVDRQQEELIWLQERWPDMEPTWERFWELRKKHIPEKYLGEVSGWTGVQKELCKSWVERGEFR